MKRILFLLIAPAVLFCTACGDQFKNIDKHVTEETIYPGKYDFANARVGFQRVEIDLLEAGRIPASEINLGKAKKTIVEYDDQVIVIDSLCSWVNIEGLSRSKLYRFKIFTADEYGNKSIPVETSAMPYFVSNLETLLVPEPRVVNTMDGLQIGWPKSLLDVMMDHCGVVYSYTDHGGQFNEGTGGPNASLLLENLNVGEEATIDLIHRVIPKINGMPILDTVDIPQQVVLIVPKKSIRANVALNRNVTTSDARNATDVGSNAVDGARVGGARWVSMDSGGTNDHWIEIDLGAAYPIEGFQMWTGNGNNSADPIKVFEFQVCTGWDHSKMEYIWTNVIAETGNTSPTYFANFNAMTTSRVRLMTHGQQVRLFELEVYVPVSEPTMRVNAALFRNVVDSSNRELKYCGQKAVDGNKVHNDYRWISATNNGPHTLDIDFDWDVPVEGFAMWTGADAPAYNQPLTIFTISRWDKNAGEWVTVLSRTGNTDPTFSTDKDGVTDFTPFTTSKLRLWCNGQQVRLFELEVYTTITF